MTKIRKVKRRKRFQANVNRKRLRNKLDKLPKIECKQIKDSWEVKKSLKGNLKDMGLAYDPNEVLKIPNSKQEALENVKNEVVATAKFSEEDFEVDKRPSKAHVAEDLEKEAKAPRERMFKLPKGQVQFVTYMMDKYGDDYKAMSRDKKNFYQLTWQQIRAKINTFTKIPEQYAEYLLAKGEIVLDDPTPLGETKKQQALENFQKHCVSKKPKKTPKVGAGWEEESIEPAEGTTETVSDIRQREDENDPAVEKKLNLFLDESEDESKVKKSSKKKPEKETVNEASNGVLQSKSVKSTIKKKAQNSDTNNSTKNEKVTEKRKAEDDKKNSKRAKKLEKLPSSDSECEEELEGEEDNSEFKNLSDLSSSDELSDDDILDDGEFVTGSEEESD